MKWNDVKRQCPSKSFKDKLEHENDDMMTNLLLTCFNKLYVTEWNDFFSIIADFVAST